MQGDQHPSSDASRPAKRRRVNLACLECRERKRKCDGQKPTCGSCKKRYPAPECVYTDENLKRGSSSYVDSLRARIRELEGLVNGQSSSSGLDRGEKAQKEARRPVKAGNETTIQSYPRTHASDGNVSNPDSDDDHDEDHWVIPGMGPQEVSLPSEDSGPPSSMTYFGPSSVFGFMRQAQHTTELSRDELQSFIVSIPVRNGHGEARLQDLIEKVPISLPTRAEADALVEGYFTGVHSLYPFLHRGTFETRYWKLWEPDPDKSRHGHAKLEAEDRTFYSLMNAVFALGVHFTEYVKPEDRAETSELYFGRSMGMLNFGMLSQGSIELVQTLLLQAQYLQSTDLPGLCWNIVGLAIRVAQSIGLHIPRSTTVHQERESVLLIELRKRLWGGCVTLDRVLAMNYGRPLMIPPNLTRDFAFPSMDDEELSKTRGNEDIRLPLKDAKINIYVHSLKLILLLGEILESFYTGPAGPATDYGQTQTPNNDLDQSRLRMLLSFDAALVSLQKSWPDNLQVARGGSSPFSSRQALTLRARFLHMRIFLLRPFILCLHRIYHVRGAQNLDSSVEDMVARTTLNSVTNTCLSATEELIDLIWERTMNATNNLSFAWSWWYNVFYIYTCATVIHVARLFRPLDLGRADDKTLRRSWQKCIQCLQKYAPYGAAARRARKALILLEKQINNAQESNEKEMEDAVAVDSGVSTLDESPSSQPLHVSPGGEWDYLASWDSLQFDTTFGLAADPLMWTGADLNSFIGANPFMPGEQQVFMPNTSNVLHSI